MTARGTVTSQLSLWPEKDQAHPWSVRESRRARRLMVRVFHSGRVEVVVPARTAPRAVQRFVERHRHWIERKCAEARGRAPPVSPFPPERIELPACEQLWHVQRADGPSQLRPEVLADGSRRLCADHRNPITLRRALRRWLTAHAAAVLEPLLQACARELGVSYGRLLVRRQRTRWGSCSTRGTISLNCCLLFQPPAVVRYLLIHELTHTVHMNHSRRFWQAVSRHCPDYGRLDRELLDGWRRVPSWVFEDDGRSVP